MSRSSLRPWIISWSWFSGPTIVCPLSAPEHPCLLSSWYPGPGRKAEKRPVRHEAALLGVLWQAAVPVAWVDPRRVRHLAEVQGENAKTDRVGACVLAAFGAGVTPAACPGPWQGTRRLKPLLTHRQSLSRSLAERRKAKTCQASRPGLPSLARDGAGGDRPAPKP